MGDKKKHNRLINQVVAINKRQFIMTNDNAAVGEITPAGISRTTVRGFLTSISLSK